MTCAAGFGVDLGASGVDGGGRLVTFEDDESSAAKLAAISALIVAYSSWIVAAGLLVGRLGTLETKTVADDVLWHAAFLGVPTVGALLAVRRRRNPVGWLLLALGLLASVSWLTGVMVEHQLAKAEVNAALGVAASVANALTPVTLLILVAFLVLFPDTRPSRWQKIMLQVAGAVTAGMVALRLLRPGQLDLGENVHFDNPLGVPALAPYRDLTDPLSTLVGFTVLVALGIVIARYWRADGARRLQYKWVVAAIAMAILLQLVAESLPEDNSGITIEDFASGIALNVGLLGVCIAIGVAVTRYRLYDLDRIISRTLAWSAVTAAVIGIYAVTVLGLGALLRAAGADAGNDLVVAASTLLAAVSARPTLRRIRARVDRRFDRAHYDAARAVESLSARLRDEVDVASVVDELTSTATSTLQPAAAWVWLPREELA